MSATINNKHRVSTLTGIAYAAPVVPLLVLMSSSVVLSGIYATYHGLSLTAISMVMTKPSFVNQVSLRFSIFREGFPENSVNSSTGNTAATGAEG